MPQKKHKNFNILCKKNFGFCVFMMITSAFILMPFVMSIVFDFRYSKAFAKTQLKNFGFEKVEILEKHSITNHISLFPITTENWFDFRAIKDHEFMEGKLICYRQFKDLKKSRCELALPKP